MNNNKNNKYKIGIEFAFLPIEIDYNGNRLSIELEHYDQ